MSKFNGDRDGTKPSTQARRYVYHVLATTLTYDLANGSGYIFDDPDMDQFDRPRVRAAVEKVIKELRRKAGVVS